MREGGGSLERGDSLAHFEDTPTHLHTCCLDSAQVGANDDQDATNEERDHSAIDFKISRRTRIWHAKQRRTTAQTLGSPTPAGAVKHVLRQNHITAKQHTNQQNKASHSTVCSWTQPCSRPAKVPQVEEEILHVIRISQEHPGFFVRSSDLKRSWRWCTPTSTVPFQS